METDSCFMFDCAWWNDQRSHTCKGNPWVNEQTFSCFGDNVQLSWTVRNVSQRCVLKPEQFDTLGAETQSLRWE